MLINIKKESAKWGPMKNFHNQSFKNLVELLGKYEEETITTYADSNANKLIFGDINDTSLKDKVDEMTSTFQNPYKAFSDWVRCECNDIEALYEAIKGRDNLVQTKLKVENKKKSDQKELDKLTEGKRTMKTLFKSSSGK